MFRTYFYICVSKDKITHFMTIHNKLLAKWKVLYSPGDASKMAERLENGYAEIFNRALREGKCNDDVFKVMADFYEEKSNLIKEYL